MIAKALNAGNWRRRRIPNGSSLPKFPRPKFGLTSAASGQSENHNVKPTKKEKHKDEQCCLVFPVNQADSKMRSPLPVHCSLSLVGPGICSKHVSAQAWTSLSSKVMATGKLKTLESLTKLQMLWFQRKE